MSSDVQLEYVHHSYRPRCNHAVDKWHDYHVVCLNTGGTVVLHIGEKRYELGTGSVWYCFPGVRIRYEAQESRWEHRHVAFCGERADAWLAEGLLGLDPHVFPKVQVRAIQEAFDQLLSAFDTDRERKKRYCDNALENFLILLEESRRRRDGPKALVSRIRRWFREEEFRPPDVSSWADRLDLGESTLRRKFVEESGKTLHQFCMEIRLKEACYLLTQSRLTQEEIADSCGYSSLPHFSKAFRASIGVPPGEYRKREVNE